MKFVNSKAPRNYALEAYKLEQEITRLQRRLRQKKEQHEAIKLYLESKYRQEGGFEFADDEGYLMRALLTEHQRQDIDDAKVRAFYAKMGVKLPMKTSEWTQLRVKYVPEDE